MEARTDLFRRMLEKNPADTRALFGLAIEYEKAADWTNAAHTLRRYLDHADDQGNAWGRLAAALMKLGRTDEAKDAYEKGIAAARRHGHPSMAMEFEESLAELDE